MFLALDSQPRSWPGARWRAPWTYCKRRTPGWWSPGWTEVMQLIVTLTLTQESQLKGSFRGTLPWMFWFEMFDDFSLSLVWSSYIESSVAQNIGGWVGSRRGWVLSTYRNPKRGVGDWTPHTKPLFCWQPQPHIWPAFWRESILIFGPHSWSRGDSAGLRLRSWDLGEIKDVKKGEGK